MHDRLFANQKELARPDLSKHAQAIGLNVGNFDQCLDSGKSTARIRKDLAEAEKLQANGTPTFFVGLTDGNSSQIKGTRIVGAVPYQTFKDAIDKLLATQKRGFDPDIRETAQVDVAQRRRAAGEMARGAPTLAPLLPCGKKRGEEEGVP